MVHEVGGLGSPEAMLFDATAGADGRIALGPLTLGCLGAQGLAWLWCQWRQDATLVDATSKCTSQTNISTYVKVDLTDTYTPTWSKFGVGKPLTFNITRTVQVS